jgi:carboxyl-terminal processing protease
MRRIPLLALPRPGPLLHPPMALWLALATAALGGCFGPGPGPETGVSPPGIGEAEALEVFDFAWTRVHETYYDTSFRGLDWEGVRDELRPAAGGAPSVDELRDVLMDMLSRLGDSHFGVIPREHADALDPERLEGAPGEPGTVGLELRVVGDRILVSRVAPGSSGHRAGVRPGWAVERIGEVPAEQLLTVLDDVPEARRLAEARVAWGAESRLAGQVGTTSLAGFRDGDEALHELALLSEAMPGVPVRFGNLPTMFTLLEAREVAAGQGCAAVVRFNLWMTTILPDLEAAFLKMRHCQGFVLDLRGNPGGVAGMVMGVSGYFMTDQQPLGVMTTRQGELRLVSMPRRVTGEAQPMEPFTGPLAIIVDGHSMSTSEIFAAGLQGLDRAHVFGEPSGGQALPALMQRLPNQDVLMYAFADFVDPRGTRIEGRGVIPDIAAPLTRDDLLAGRDASLEAAIRWIEAGGPRRPTQ